MDSELDSEGSTPGEPSDRPSPPVRRVWGKVATVVVVAVSLIAAFAVLSRPPNEPPRILATTVSAGSATTGEPLTFAGQATDPDGDPLTYTWNFGDNVTATGASLTHSYLVPGRFVALLTVMDGRGGEATNDGSLIFVAIRLRASEIDPPSAPPQGTCPTGCTVGPAAAILNADQTTVVAGTSVRFAANASWAYGWVWNNVSNRSEGGAPVVVPAADNASLFTTFTYGWGDGTANTGGDSNSVGLTKHTFASPGNFFVRLTLTLPTVAGTLTVSAGYTIRVTPVIPTMATKHPNLFTTATFGEPDSLDPAVDAETSGGEILQNVYDTLIWYESGTENTTVLVPRLATDVPTLANDGISPDGKNYTLTIRVNAEFHSGALVTADDVVYSVQRVLAIHDPDGPSWILEQVLTNYVAKYVDGCGPTADQPCSLADYAILAFPAPMTIPQNIRAVLEAQAPEAAWSGIPMNRSVAWAVSNSTIERVGETQVRIHLTRPYPAFLQAMASTVGSVVEKSCAKAQDAWGSRNDLLDRQRDCGSGPFRLEAWVPNQVIVLTRFDEYWDSPPAIESVHIEKVGDIVTREFMLLAGDADTAAVNRDHQFDVMNPDGTPRYTSLRIVKDRPSFDVTVFGYNQAINASGTPDSLEVPITFFADIHLRRAFSYAFDYQSFLANVTFSTGVQLRGPIAQGIPGYNLSTPLYSFNLTKAAVELQQTPYWASGFNLTLDYNAGNTERRLGCLLLKEGLEALDSVGGAGPIAVTVRALDWPAYLRTLRSGGLPIFFLGWRPNFADPDDYVMPFLRTGGVFAGRIGYSNMTLDGLIDRAAGELNQTKRDRMYQDLTTRAVVDDVPYLWVYQSWSFHVERTWVRGYYFNPMLSGLDYHRLWKATG